jgi:ribonuclease Z
MEISLKAIEPGLVFSAGDFQVRAFRVYHRGPDSFGFLFEEAPRRPFLPEKAEALDIPQGPWRGELVSGQTVTLPDGREIRPEQVLGPERPGTRLVHVGDVGRTSDLEEVCQAADALVIEATYLEQEAEMASEFAHLTARQAAELARQAGVSHLILTHLSRRYRERDVLAEARAVFPGARVARDFDHFQIRRGEMVKIDEPNGLRQGFEQENAGD